VAPKAVAPKAVAPRAMGRTEPGHPPAVARIFLVGFMACGKTAVGSALAARLGVRFVDLDREVEAAAGAAVATIFARRGEAAFRDLEHQALRRTSAVPSAVVATGGGTMIAERNRELIRELGTSVWIDAGFDVILDRLSPRGRSKRPLFRDEDQARELYLERLPFYRLADLRIEVAPASTARGVAARIADLLARENLCGT
jgi:shikimate kinase